MGKVRQIIILQFIGMILPFSLNGQAIIPGAERTEKYFPELANKRIAVVCNHTSLINRTLLVDSLLLSGLKIKKIFCPEHGFHGTAAAGEKITNSIDSLSGLQVVSLYGKHYKPTPDDLSDADIVVFDLQDVGVRFYTYLSTLHYVMEACAENDKPLIVLDHPNPNGHYISGPIMKKKFRSFAGLHPVPIVYGMTIGEYAQMINGEKWLKGKKNCKLMIVPCLNYTHDSLYHLKASPSPNLRNMQAVYLYPSLALFEGTVINVGRGSDFPFQVFGNPDLMNSSFSYTPKSNDSTGKYLLHSGKLCYGVDLRDLTEKELSANRAINIKYLLYAYKNFPNKKQFFNLYFLNLSGTKRLKRQIKWGRSPEKIERSWDHGLKRFSKVRRKYLLYEDFHEPNAN
jgi:uncharacterized protein YbbC (DUF1343 family)